MIKEQEWWKSLDRQEQIRLLKLYRPGESGYENIFEIMDGEAVEVYKIVQLEKQERDDKIS